MRTIRPLLWLTFSATLAAGCGDPMGSPCQFEGSGFTASDNCRHRCLVHRTIHCPDGTPLNGPAVCSGPVQCNPGECPDGQICYHVPDGFKKDSYCISASMCGDQTSEELQQWELRSKQTSDALIEAWEERKERRQTTAPANVEDA